MIAAAQSEGATIRVIEEEGEREELAALIGEGRQRARADVRVRAERSGWIHQNGRALYDGMPGHEVDPMDGFDGNRARQDPAPAYAILSTRGDNPFSWLSAGQAMMRVLLTAADEGVSASFANELIMHKDLRARASRWAADSQHPQVVLRLGRGTAAEPTPRRPVQAVTSNAWPLA